MKETLSNIVWCIVACFLRLSKALSSSHFATIEILGIKRSMEDGGGEKKTKKKNPTKIGLVCFSSGPMWKTYIGFTFGLKALMKGTMFADAAVVFLLPCRCFSSWVLKCVVSLSRRAIVFFCTWDTAK